MKNKYFNIYFSKLLKLNNLLNKKNSYNIIKFFIILFLIVILFFFLIKNNNQNNVIIEANTSKKTACSFDDEKLKKSTQNIANDAKSQTNDLDEESDNVNTKISGFS